MNDWERLNKTRKQLVTLGIVGLILLVAGLILPIVLMAKHPLFFNPLFILFGMIPGVVCWLIAGKGNAAYRKEYKALVVNRAAAGMFDEYNYYPGMGFDYKEIQATGIMYMGNRYKSEDLVEGRYRGVPFRRADMYIAQHTSTGKSSHTTVYLRGTWMVFSYNKSFVSDVQVASKAFGFSNKKTSRLFNRSGERRHKLETEDLEFNRMFDVTCQNDAEAFYLLTPRVMQMLKLLQADFMHPFMVGFVNNSLHIAVSSGKDTMEPTIYKALKPELEIEKTRRELRAICNVIDSLAIDRDIFKE